MEWTWKTGVAAAALALSAGGCASGSTAGSEEMSPAPTPAAQPAVSAAASEAGRAIFSGKGNCYACHGPEGKGTMLAPDLTDADWLIADGSLASIVKVVTEGVAQPTTSSQPMPARGGGTLSDAEIRAVSQYVVSLRQR